MTRGLFVGKLDPITILESTENRNLAEVSLFFRTLGWPLSPGNVERLIYRNKLKVDNEGRLAQQEINKILRKIPSWLKQLPAIDLQDGMVSFRVLNEENKISLDEFLGLAKRKTGYKVHSSECMTLIMHRSWLNDLCPIVEEPKVMAEVKAVKRKESLPHLTTKPKQKQKIALDLVPKQLEASQLKAPQDTKKLDMVNDKGKTYISLNEAVEFFQVYGYDILYIDLYNVGVKRKKPLFKIVRRNKRLFVELAYLQKIIDSAPDWLASVSTRYTAPTGYKLTREMIQELGLKPARVYEAIRTNLINAEVYSRGEKQGKIYVISDSEIADITSNSALISFLKGEKVSIAEIEKARELAKIVESEKPPHEVTPRLDGGPMDGEVITFHDPTDNSHENNTPEVCPQVVEGLKEILYYLHKARRLLTDYEDLVMSGATDEEIVEALRDEILKHEL